MADPSTSVLGSARSCSWGVVALPVGLVTAYVDTSRERVGAAGRLRGVRAGAPGATGAHRVGHRRCLGWLTRRVCSGWRC